eukprot:TRINITY_DN31893_c1_g1_i1.p1 TRINITY_DN31893_c1_g1~~TRINITY_DN31893_c1_g1_i1.p1  ORF type:complete len:719 (-),score=113.59 TRINITY_DN31893_c1_g1_i1:158-2284(-)
MGLPEKQASRKFALSYVIAEVPLDAGDLQLSPYTAKSRVEGRTWSLQQDVLIKHGFKRSGAEKLTFPVRGELSPECAMDPRQFPGVPATACYFMWSYPVAEWGRISTSTSSYLLDFLRVGGFVFTDASGNFVHLSTILRMRHPGSTAAVLFGPPEPWEATWKQSLLHANRFKRVTLKEFSDAGAEYFCWLRPNEVLLGSNGKPLPSQPNVPYGGFVYLFETNGTGASSGRDLYYPILQNSKFIIHRGASAFKTGTRLKIRDPYLVKAAQLLKANQETWQDPSVTACKLVLFAMFGASGWWGCEAIYSQTPLLIQTLPEKASLGNMMCMTSQLGNLAPMIYMATSQCSDARVDKVIKALQVVAITALLLCAFVWDIELGGFSIPFLVCMFCLGCVGCMTDCTVWSYSINFPPACSKAISMGNGPLAGLSCQCIAVLQLSFGTEPLFGTCTFLILAAALQGCCLLAIFGIEGKVCTTCVSPPSPEDANPMLLAPLMEAGGQDAEAKTALVNVNEALGDMSPKVGASGSPMVPRNLPPAMIAMLKVVLFSVKAMTYTIDSMLPFVARAYLDPMQSRQLLLWMCTLRKLGNIWGCSNAVTGETSSRFRDSLLLGSAAVIMPGVYAFFVCLAALPDQRFQYDTAKFLLPVLCVLFDFCSGFLTTSSYLTASNHTSSKQRAARLASRLGFCGQMGAMSANIGTFVALSIFHVLG